MRRARIECLLDCPIGWMIQACADVCKHGFMDIVRGLDAKRCYLCLHGGVYSLHAQDAEWQSKIDELNGGATSMKIEWSLPGREDGWE